MDGGTPASLARTLHFCPTAPFVEGPWLGAFQSSGCEVTWHCSCYFLYTMVIDSSSFTDIARHLHGISEGLLDGMKKVVELNPSAPNQDPRHLKAEWLAAVESFVRVNQDVLTLAELLRALLEANESVPTKPALS